MKVVVVMPAYNAAKTLKQTYKDIPKDVVNEVILVDDDSADKTVAVAKQLGITTLVHKKTWAMVVTKKPAINKRLKQDQISSLCSIRTINMTQDSSL